jgi:DNA invertase Pin-like site-specific DNA recombinase
MNFALYARKSTDEDDRQLLSIEAQLDELREFARKEQIHIAREFVESMSAKMPGRPVFDGMIRELERGHVDGILSWHPDRLARNAVDGGRIVHLLSTGKLKALKFPTFWFENTPQGKFMLNIAFGQSQYFVENLVENVWRGLRQKLRRGEYPSRAPVGYLNETRTHTVIVDEAKAPFVRRLFETYANDTHSASDLCELAKEWGLTSINGKAIRPNRMSTLLTDPFYVGMFRYRGETYEGAHPPIVANE